MKVNETDLKNELDAIFGPSETKKKETYTYEVYETFYTWSEFANDYIKSTGEKLETYETEAEAIAYCRDANKARQHEVIGDLSTRYTYIAVAVKNKEQND